ncbi:MFS transporter [Thalassotalea euphylliae]|uniref:MFS transporter n=1 Tax=Thalassotalea euphylliae TaxID=1655234 RepID=A0A3E0TQP3_9GAMM|nr:MFS transporter [Thalassotalea euphylliae]REL26834.1 MFS transporter [Thalassotalea euphylliae]
MNIKPLPWLMLASVYITQYIGIAFIMSAAVAILRQQGVALDKLALLNLAAIPLAGKVLYAPLIDNYRLFFHGQYRSWLLAAQAGMTCLLLLASLLDINQAFSAIFIILIAYVLCIDIQDVSIDGLACKLFDSQSHKFANSVQISGNLLGNIIGGGIILMLYPWLGWQGSLLLLAGLTSIALLQVLRYVEPHLPHQQQANEQASPLWRDLWGFVKQQQRWFAVLAIFPLGFTSGFAILNPLLVDSHWTLVDIGFATKVYGSAVGFLSALLATLLIARLGRVKTLITLSLSQAAGLCLMLPLTLGDTEKLSVYLAISAYFISFPAILVTLATIAMDKAADTVRKATFFTLQFSFVSLMGFIYSALTMALAKYLGYYKVIVFGVLTTALMSLVVYLVLYKNQRTQSDARAHDTY